MLRLTLLVLSLVAWLHSGAHISVVAQATGNEQPADVAAVEQALQRGEAARRTVVQFIDQKLPPTGRADGEEVLSILNQALQTCETDLRRNKLIGQYKECVGFVQGLAMATLGEVAAKHWPEYAASGAARATLFW